MLIDLAKLIQEIIEYKGDIIFDSSKPDGTLKKQLDVSKLFNLGWKPSISLSEGIKLAYDDFLKTTHF